MPTPTLPISEPTILPGWFELWMSRHTKVENVSHGRHGTLKRCGACRKRILTGDDSDIGAFAVRVDLTPLNETTELACLIARRRTYLVEGSGERITIFSRDKWQITGLPPGKNVILPAHQCGAKFSAPPKPKKQKKENTNECPF